MYEKKPLKQEPLRQKKYPRLKELRDVMGGEAAWENADSMEEQCTKDGCDNRKCVFFFCCIRAGFILFVLN